MAETSERRRARIGSALAAFLAAAAVGTATTFQVAYVSGTSGPGTGGSAAQVVGNGMLAGATVTVGGVAASASLTSSTRLGITAPALGAGALYDLVVSNPGGASAALPRAWFSDFLDVPQSSPYHAPVETIFRDGVTSGCGGGNYCPSASITRSQMAVFLLRAEHGGGYVPPAATGTVFGDVHVGDFAADWIEQLSGEGITGGCSASPPLYCPNNPVTRGQMAVFLLKIFHGTSYVPVPAQGVFSDVAASSPLAPWIEELSRLAITSGCGGTSYCPTNSVTRGQMAVFMAKSFHRPEAVRFLEQASWGPTDPDVGHLLGIGYLPWLAEQFTAAPSTYPATPLWPEDVPASCDDPCRITNYSFHPLWNPFFQHAFYGTDQLRQRASWALHKIIVVSGDTIGYPFYMAPYVRTLDQYAFGNYRDLLWNVTLNPAMGEFLNMDTSTKYDPNENYAREIMQLFSIGTELLNPDGTTQNDGNGNPLPTYNQGVVDQFKRVYTGWYVPEISCPPPNAGEQCWDFVSPMTLDPDSHDTDEKDLFVGFLPSPTILPAGQTGDQDLNGAIDAIFHHPNVGPYLARELIHSLVTSNPAPAYVERVAGFFDDNGAGVRGSLWAMWKAILLDPEARNAPADPIYGKLREPVVFINAFLRPFRPRSYDRSTQSDGHVHLISADLAQDVFNPPSVFSYYSQFHTAPPASAGVLGPEYGIMNSRTSLERANFIQTMTFDGGVGPNSTWPLGTSIDLSELTLLASNPANLVDRLDRLMLHGTMSDALRALILSAVGDVDPADPLRRAQQALYLVGVSSQYQVQR